MNDTKEGDEVWVRQVFLHDSLLVQGLSGSSITAERETIRQHTFVAFAGPSLEYILMRLTQTFEPLRFPS